MEFPEWFELGEGIDFSEVVLSWRRVLLVAALREGGNLTRAAELLKVNRSSLREMMNRYGIEDSEWKPVLNRHLGL